MLDPLKEVPGDNPVAVNKYYYYYMHRIFKGGILPPPLPR